MKCIFISLLVLCSGLFVCCHSPSPKQSAPPQISGAEISVPHPDIRYAEGFKLEYRKDYILLRIRDPQSANGPAYCFALRPKGTNPRIPNGIRSLDLPINRFICMTALQLSNFICLEATEKVVGISSTRFLKNKKIRQQMAVGKTQKIGIEGNFDPEIIMNLAPDVILISPFKQGGYDAMKEVDIPLIPHLGYKETTPLGQAEWIKLIGLLTGKEKEASEIFNGIENRYNTLKKLTANVQNRPVVLSGEIHGGSWYAVGGRSFLAQVFQDAGANYFLKDDLRSGGIHLDFETVYNQADRADYWRILNSFPGSYSYEALKAQDARYADFRAFREKGVIYCNMREKAYYEEMPMEPDVLLSDFIKVFHPELLPDYTPVYYTLLKE